MVKPDVKRDYYADLEVPPNADQETIKRRFRELAKLYHPDRNPGREVDVVPKFQAVQAAHEILNDPIQKAKYDEARAKLNRANVISSEPPAFKKPPPPPPRTNSGYPTDNFGQPPASTAQSARRDPSAGRAYPASPSARRPNSTSSSTAEKWSQFGRTTAERWNKNNFDAAAAAEGLRGMRSGTPGSQGPSRRAPTAPKTASDVPPHSAGPGPSPGFPGLGRTSSNIYPYPRGYNPAASNGDEPPSSSGSAYAQTHRDRPPSSGAFGANPQPQQRTRPSVSPLRQTRSAHFEDVVYAARPGLQRNSSKYAHQGGERTAVNTANLGRSASVRNSPVEPKWKERPNFGSKQPSEEDRSTRPRHRSMSPPRANGPRFEFSASSTSSDDEDVPPPGQRPKATPRARTNNKSNMVDDPALTGHFPSTNYTRVVDDSQYHFPPPETKGPTRRPFSGMPSPLEEVNSGAEDTNHLRPSAAQNDPGVTCPSREQNKFDPDHWRDTFEKSEENIFRPTESTSKDRRSPTRNSRNRPLNRSQASNQSILEPTQAADIAAGVKRVTPEEVQAKSAAFQAGKLAQGWADRFRSSHNKPKTPESEVESDNKQDDTIEPDLEAGPNNDKASPIDEMDVDEPSTGREPVSPLSSSDTSYRVFVEEEDSPTPSSHGGRRSSTTASVNGGAHLGGINNLDDLTKHAPFTPSGTGLKDLNDLHGTLPFESKAASELPLHRTTSHSIRDLNLPRPPEPPYEPQELTQFTWKAYSDEMNKYIHDWSQFNASMLSHFQARQEQMTRGMYRNWISAQGDGASADAFEHGYGTGHAGERAGYQTYMTWLADDRKCRAWWEFAWDEHEKCMLGLGRVRAKVKAMAHVNC